VTDPGHLVGEWRGWSNYHLVGEGRFTFMCDIFNIHLLGFVRDKKLVIGDQGYNLTARIAVLFSITPPLLYRNPFKHLQSGR